MFSILASSCVQGARMFEMLAAQDMGASFWLVELFRDRGEETKKRLDSRLRFERFKEPMSFTLYIGLWDTYDAVLIKKKFQVSPKHFVCRTARFKRDLCAVGEPNCVIEKWWLNLYLISQAACTQYESPSWWEGHSCTKTGHNTLLLPSGQFEMEKRWPNFCLISQAARRCTRPSARRALCVAASWWEGQPFRRLDTSHFYCPFLVCCA